MNHSQPKQYSASTHRAVVYGGAHAPRAAWADFETSFGCDSAWQSTVRADLEPMAPSQPFREMLAGLATREVNEPEVLRHLFGMKAGTG